MSYIPDKNSDLMVLMRTLNFKTFPAAGKFVYGAPKVSNADFIHTMAES
jgi:hypothetical protein